MTPRFVCSGYSDFERSDSRNTSPSLSNENASHVSKKKTGIKIKKTTKLNVSSIKSRSHNSHENRRSLHWQLFSIFYFLFFPAFFVCLFFLVNTVGRFQNMPSSLHLLGLYNARHFILLYFSFIYVGKWGLLLVNEFARQE